MKSCRTLPKKKRTSAARYLKLPELEQCKTAILNSFLSTESKRSYRHSMGHVIKWYCSEPRLALNRVVVLRYKMFLESLFLSPSTISCRLAAVRRLAFEAADEGLLSQDLVAGIQRVKGPKRLGERTGNWLTLEQGQRMIEAMPQDTMQNKRDAAMIALLFGCGLRRAEVTTLEVRQIQRREDHWTIVDLVGKGRRVRTVPIPEWVKTALDGWLEGSGVSSGRLFRPVRKNGMLWSNKISPNVVWHAVKRCALRVGIIGLAPHDLRRSCARLCHEAGGELEQIQFLLGHSSVQTTERYIGCKQRIGKAVNDRIEIQFTSRPVPVANLLLFPEMAERQPFHRGTAKMRPNSEGEARDGIRLRQSG